MKIRVVCPAWWPQSGGVRVLHYLAYLCHRLGHSVDAMTSLLNPAWPTYSTAWHALPDLFICSEIVSPTPEYSHTVRWALYFPGVLGGPTKYPDHEMVWTFDQKYMPSCPRVFNLPHIEVPTFDTEKVPSVETAYWFHKGQTLPVEEDAALITQDWPKPREALFDLLRRTKKFRTTDQNTAMLVEAYLCGCECEVWDGEKWCPVHVENAQALLHDEERDLARVERFLRECAQHFNLPYTACPSLR